MANQEKINSRLSRHFHKTFIPERSYINAMLKFASTGKKGDAQKIANITGIPTGKSSGKVTPTLDYCRGMGLIELSLSSFRSSVKEPVLTNFGRAVFFEDPFLNESITQWICHFNLCSTNIGADVWFQVFSQSFNLMGLKFDRAKIENYLNNIYELSNFNNIIGPLIRMYNDPASFSLCGAIKENKNICERISAPLTKENIWGYGAWLINQMEVNFPYENQVTVTDLERAVGWRSIPGWNISDSHEFLINLEQKKIVAVDRQMEPWVIQRISKSNNLWEKIYDDLL
ncbi:MAG: DUF4007 family protein [Candidatus Muiribacteriota bacterium]